LVDVDLRRRIYPPKSGWQFKFRENNRAPPPSVNPVVHHAPLVRFLG
jgi:hypothetical protein